MFQSVAITIVFWFSNFLLLFRHAAQDSFGILESKHAAIGNRMIFLI